MQTSLSKKFTLPFAIDENNAIASISDSSNDTTLKTFEAFGTFDFAQKPTPLYSIYRFQIPVAVAENSWYRLISQKNDFRTQSISVGTQAKICVASMPITGRAKIDVRSFYFLQPETPLQKINQEKVKTTPLSPQETISDLPQESRQEDAANLPTKYTRISVPRDAIKLEDRLNYLLQPPLESLLGQPTLEMPFEPFPYQRSGVSFLYAAHRAILADEMGLGKTMQAITTIRLLIRSGELRNILLVCPKPLVSNWRREFNLWAPEINVQVIEGAPARRKWLWQLDNVPVRIANYELMNRDLEYFDRPRSQGGPHFDLVVLDESQRIKNQNSATSRAVRALSRSRSWALTGTPVENSPNDLVGIFEFLSPGYLSTGMKPSAMSEMVGDYILRRTKDKVLTDLPPKIIRDANLELTPSQKITYAQAEEDGTIRLNDMSDSLTIQNVFELVLRLKQICNFDPRTGESAKLERLLADVEEVAASGRKAIIFSQWVETLTKLRDYLADYHPVEYHGKVPSKQRDAVIRKFRDAKDCHVILMSYGAGSVGLNLQFASYVFLFDRWWNPAVEDQAINRAHRIGAAEPVTVTRFLIADTIEERIDNILQSKRELFEEIMSGAQGFTSTSGMSHGMRQEDIFGLFNLKVPRSRKN
ncbi:MAG: DEAD/DEAH box helicase [Planctomycetaceae bacterium]|jgi:SNF2 family DNA or RNA helicase|nr:DEAD/DEAH box helicase [Planctomycetaceae bacterium]